MGHKKKEKQQNMQESAIIRNYHSFVCIGFRIFCFSLSLFCLCAKYSKQHFFHFLFGFIFYYILQDNFFGVNVLFWMELEITKFD